MSLRQGESGANKIIRVAAGFDLSSNTELTLDFTLPDGTTTSQKVKADGVVLGTINVTDDDLGALLANQYVEYPVEVGFLVQDGTWNVFLTYTNTASSPTDIFIGKCGTFDALPLTCS